MPRKTKDEEVIKKDKKKTAKTSTTGIVEVVKNLVAPKKESKSKKSTSSKKTDIEVEKKSTSIKKSNKTSDKASTSSKKASKTSAKKSPTSSKTASKSTTKKSTTTKSTSSKTSTSKKASTTKATAEKLATKKANTKSSTATKSTTKKASAKSSTSKRSTTKKANTKKSVTKKASTKKSVAVATTEYYDLPATYNRTIVKILAQTPYSLFVYWEISEDDKTKLQQQYGEQFFQNTKPYLIIKNETMNYSFEVEINDYANSWYIHIHDSDCKYAVQLIRRPINNQVSIPSSFVDIISSNEMSIPNDHILFDKLGKTVFFKNVQSNYIVEKDISSLSFISNIGRIYNVYDLYKEIYKNELDGDELGIGLSSSGFSSTFQ